jgi:hypothetical protein
MLQVGTFRNRMIIPVQEAPRARSGRLYNRDDQPSFPDAKVAELADAPDLGSGGETRGGSSPPFRTNPFCNHLRKKPLVFLDLGFSSGCARVAFKGEGRAGVILLN